MTPPPTAVPADVPAELSLQRGPRGDGLGHQRQLAQVWARALQLPPYRHRHHHATLYGLYNESLIIHTGRRGNVFDLTSKV